MNRISKFRDDKGNRCLIIQVSENCDYDIDYDRLAELDWVEHLSEKQWMTTEMVREFIILRDLIMARESLGTMADRLARAVMNANIGADIGRGSEHWIVECLLPSLYDEGLQICDIEMLAKLRGQLSELEEVLSR